MPSLFRRSNGVHYLVSTVNGRRVWKSTGYRTKKKALNFAESEEPKPKEAPQLTLSQFTTQILTSLKVNLAPGTVQIYRAALPMFQKIAGDRPLREYTPQMIEHYKSIRIGEVSPVKVNIDFSRLLKNPLKILFHICRETRVVVYIWVQLIS